MLFRIPEVITTQELSLLKETLEQAEFVDGKITAGWHAKLVKNNQQLSRESQSHQELRRIVEKALKRHPLFQAAVLPKIIHSILFSRYEPGMSYGTHVDNALMGNQHFWRSDVSFTLFLTSPESYSGGELVIEGADDEQSYKLDAGTMIVYPSSTLHRVETVTAGIRLVVVGWVQSLVRNPQEREILFDLETARRAIFAKNGKTVEFDLLSKTYTNLLRKWSE